MKFRSLAVAAAAATLAVCGPANAVVFNLHDTGGAAEGTGARLGFDIAAAYWSSVLKDNVTVNLDIGFRSLGEGILGSTGSSTGSCSVARAVSAARTAYPSICELSKPGSGASASTDRKSTRLNSSHTVLSRMPSSA